MFFVLSKLLSYALSPLLWIICLLILALISRAPARKKAASASALVLLAFCSNPFLFDEAMRAWEWPATRAEDVTGTYDYGIVLSGMATYDLENGQINFREGVDRLLHAVRLYHLGKIRKIFITGGTGSLLQTEQKEAEFLRDYLIEIGFPGGDVLIEPDSKNTRENALFTSRRLADHHPDARYLLITSAYHMRRSLACFHKVGLRPDAYAVDACAGPTELSFDYLLVPSEWVLGDWGVLLHEIVGYFAYWAKGYV